MQRAVDGLVWWAALVALVVGMSLSVACDKGGEGGEGGEGEEEETVAPEDLSPEDLGTALGRKYIAAMLDLKELVEPLPAIEELQPQLDELHEQYVQELVVFGHARWALDETQRMQSDSALRGVMNREVNAAIGGLDWMTAAMSHYRPLDNDLANKISSFNTITQYADFELLQRQNADEATRLGVPPAAE